jgi:hypothetical protein
VESTAQDDDIRAVKRRKRHTSSDTSQTAQKSTKPVPTSAAVKMFPKSVLTGNFFARLRTTDTDMDTAGAENALPEQESPRKPGRPLPIVMTSTIKIVRLQSDLKYHVKGEQAFGDKRNVTRIVIKEKADCSAIKSYPEKNNLLYFTFSNNSENAIKAAIRHLPPRHAGRRYFQQP